VCSWLRVDADALRAFTHVANVQAVQSNCINRQHSTPYPTMLPAFVVDTHPLSHLSLRVMCALSDMSASDHTAAG